MKRFIIILPIVLMLGLCFVEADSSAITYSSNVDLHFTFNPALTINLSSANLLISNLIPGTSADSNIINVNVLTNNIAGYTLNATVGNATTYNNRNLNGAAGNSSNFQSIAYGSSLTNLTTDNTWGYSFSLDNRSTWANYDGLPLYSDTTNIATLKTSTSPSATSSGDIVNFKIAAKASATQPADEYKNVINFEAVANPIPTPGPVACEANKICYNDNSLGEAEGAMGKQVYANGTGSGSTITGNTEATLLASNFSRQGYGFAGWNTAPDYSGTNYGPQETITTPADMSAGLPLYAIWVESEGNLQGWTGCSSMNIGDVTALDDARDDNTYAVAKLADGNCWMIENLRLEAENTRGNAKEVLAQGYGTSSTYGNFSGLADAENTGFSDTYSANTLYSNDGSNDTINIGTSKYPAYRMPRYNNYNHKASSADRPQNPTTNSDTNSTTNAGMYSYGNYYTWHAAIADLTYNGTNNQSATGTSLCPAGWHLPKGGNKSNEANNEIWSLVVDGIDGGTKPANYDSSNYPYYTGTPEGNDASNKLRAYPNNFLYSGYFSSWSAYDRGSVGYYWSSTAGSNSGSYILYLSSSSVRPGNGNNNKYSGQSIRCTAGT